MIKIEGDFAKHFARWNQLLETSQVFVKRTTRAQAEVTITLIGEGFEDEKDPYGTTWAPKQVDDGRKVLHGETSRLRTGWHVTQVGEKGFRVDPSVEYAAYHQAPRNNSRPQRMQVPSDARGLPRRWKEEYETIALAEFIAHFAETANGQPPRTKRVAPSMTGGSGSEVANSRRSRAGKTKGTYQRRRRTG